MYHIKLFYLLIAGLLYCYEPKLYGMDPNNMTKKQLKQLPDRYLQMLDSLLQDFKLQPNDWHHAATATKSWCCFMKKMYNAFSEVGSMCAQCSLLPSF